MNKSPRSLSSKELWDRYDKAAKTTIDSFNVYNNEIERRTQGRYALVTLIVAFTAVIVSVCQLIFVK